MKAERPSDHDSRELQQEAAAFIDARDRFIDDHADVLEPGDARDNEDSEDDPQSAFERELLRLKVALSFPFLNDGERHVIFAVAYCAQLTTMAIVFNSFGTRADRSVRNMEISYMQARKDLEETGIPKRLTPLQSVVLYEHFLAVRFPTGVE